MTTRANRRYVGPFVVGILTFGVLLLWVCSAGAVKVVKEKSKQVETDEKPAPNDQKNDSNATTTRTLLEAVKSQKDSGTSTDSRDTWIDKNRDGVNDLMKKPKTKSSDRIRIRRTEPVPQTPAPSSNMKKKEPPVRQKEPKKKDDDSTKKLRRR
jgi:hypothetical protein